MKTDNQDSNQSLKEHLEKARTEFEKEHKQRIYKLEITRKIRKKYSIDDELAILRQKDTKPVEFQEWFNFVESIKEKLKTN